WYLRNSNSPGAPDVKPFAYGAADWIPVSGDWDGDGITTVGVFDPIGQFGQAPATWYLRNSDTPGAPDFPPSAYGAAGWVALSGDWDGDGDETVGVFDAVGQFGQPPASWYLNNSNSNSNSPGGPPATPFAYGSTDWQPLVGAWASSTRPLLVLGG